MNVWVYAIAKDEARFAARWMQSMAAGGTYAAGSTGGEASVSLTVEEIPSHDHTVSLMGRSIYGGGDTYGALNNDGTATYSYTTTATGGGQPHNNMPPYQAVYAWQRTA